MQTCPKWLVATMLPLVFATASLAQGQPVPVPEKDYRSLTDTRRSFTNFNVEVVRGFVIDAETADLYAVNAYESTVVHHVGTAGIAARWRTVANPVSIAFFEGDLLVLGQGNHALARHDRTTGRIVDLLMLRSEPADLVVDPDRKEAWVSCMGDDSVLQISLSPRLSIIKRWSWADGLELKRPRFLFLDRQQPDNPDDNVVYVAPLVSGNNTLSPRLGPTTGVAAVFDGNDASLFPQGGLPDEDLFRISPRTGTVDAVLRQAGSLLTAHGRNPLTGDYWMLTVDHNNVDPTMLTEPSVRGKFADNVLALTAQASFPGPGQPTGQPTSFIDLDNTTPGSGPVYVPSRSVSFPYALDFDAASGWAAIASSTTPNVVLVDSLGVRQADMLLTHPTNPALTGSVVRTVDIFGDLLVAYCQQTSNILVWTLNPFNVNPSLSLSLGNDPSPEPVQRGRATWYDAVRSLDGRSSCNSCHPQGGADGLVWQISNTPVDEKPQMVTQTLMGIEDTFPYHWRGERDLADFNGAFKGLLGAAQNLDETNGELDDFLEFIFSLRPPANALQTGVFSPALPESGLDFDRKIKDVFTPWVQDNGLVATPLVGDPTDGEFFYHDVDSDGAGPCTACHFNPTGTNGDFAADVPSPIASKSNFDVTQLDNQLNLKHQPLFTLQTSLGPLPINLLGSGTLHDGQIINLFDFISFFNFSAQNAADVAAFVSLFDTGTAPSIHYAARLNADQTDRTAANIQRWLIDQANSPKGWVGIAVAGTFPVSGTPTFLHWMYNPRTGLFVPEDTGVIGPQPFGQFVTFAAQGEADNVFFGTPPGNERRLGVDFDDDGLDTGGEVAAGTDRWNPDSDGDGWPDGYEVANGSNPTLAGSTPSDSTPPSLSGSITLDFVNASQAKFFFSTDEPATWQITVSTPGGPQIVDSRSTADTVHTALVHKLLPSTIGTVFNKVNTFTGNLVLTDLSGNSSPPIPIAPFNSGTMLHLDVNLLTVVGSLALSNEGRTATTYSATADIRVDFRENSPPFTPAQNEVVVAQLLKQAANGQDWDIVPLSDITHNAPATDFLLAGTPYAGGAGRLPGPFLVLNPTTAAGTAAVDFTVSNLSSGQKILFNVLAVIPAEAGHDPLNPAFTGPNLTTYQTPATPDEGRNVESSI